MSLLFCCFRLFVYLQQKILYILCPILLIYGHFSETVAKVCYWFEITLSHAFLKFSTVIKSQRASYCVRILQAYCQPKFFVFLSLIEHSLKFHYAYKTTCVINCMKNVSHFLFSAFSFYFHYFGCCFRSVFSDIRTEYGGFHLRPCNRLIIIQYTM